MQAATRARTAAAAVLAATAVTVVGASGHPAAAAAQTTRQVQVCPPASAGAARCLAVLDVTSGAARNSAGASPQIRGTILQPYGPADLVAAYGLPSASAGAHQTVAIVDAYDDPNAAADLATYRSRYHLPACTVASGCFRQVNQRGGTRLPKANAGWALEESLDLDMVSAVCPRCSIVLVEGDDNQFTSLGAAEDTAVALGADVVSNSYGGGESADEVALLARHYDHPGTTLVASTGDAGYGVQIPAAAPQVIAAGGTSLFSDQPGARGWRETAWSGAGSGCSAYEPKPAWQHDPSCGNRAVADVSAVADPSTPVAVYDTFQVPGWVSVGGTSVAAPLIAGVYALAGNAASIDPGPYLYARHKQLYDVRSDASGTCGHSYLCDAGRGYDGPTGLGTPHGTGAF